MIRNGSELDRCLQESLSFPTKLPGEIEGSKWLILGGTGFVGKWITLYGLELWSRFKVGPEVVIASRDVAMAEKQLRSFLPPRFELPKVTSYHDILGRHASESNLNEVDTIFHSATPTHGHSGSIYEVLEITKVLIEKCIDLNAPKFIHLSSGGVYQRGDFKGRFVTEDTPRVESEQSVNAYQRVKVDLEKLVESAHKQGMIRGANPRLFAFAGPGFPLNQEYAFADFVRLALANKSIVIRGNPQTRRSYMHPLDMTQWILQVWLNIDSIGLNPTHIGSSVPVSIFDLATQIAQYFGSNDVQSLSSAYPEEEWYVPEAMRMRNLGCELEYSSIESILDSWSNFLSPQKSAWS